MNHREKQVLRELLEWLEVAPEIVTAFAGEDITFDQAIECQKLLEQRNVANAAWQIGL